LKIKTVSIKALKIAGRVVLQVRFMLIICILMVVSMIQIIFEIPGAVNIKEKRRIIRSVLAKMHSRFHISAAEVDLQDSLSFTQIGGAIVSNSRDFGETVLHKVFNMIEKETPVRIQDMSIHSEDF
jgi:uncharacterized protein YlxP (DUF503 family)